MKKLPKNFAILSKIHNPIWIAFIDWLNEKTQRNYNGENQDYFYGMIGAQGFYAKIAPSKAEIITLEYWAECVGLLEERKIIGYSLLKDIPLLQKGALFTWKFGEEKSEHWINDELKNNYFSYTDEEIKSLPDWFAPVYEKSETVEIADLTFLLKQDKVFLNDQDITEQLKKLLNAIK